MREIEHVIRKAKIVGTYTMERRHGNMELPKESLKTSLLRETESSIMEMKYIARHRRI